MSGKGSVNPLFLSICSGVSFGAEHDTKLIHFETGLNFSVDLKTASSNQISID